MLLSTGASMHAAIIFASVTVSVESVDGPIPGVRVTWNTTVPPDCVAFVTVEFRTSSHGPVVAFYNSTNTSVTEVLQTGLQCGTYYYIRVAVTGETSNSIPVTLNSRPWQVLVGGIFFFLIVHNEIKNTI